MQLITIFLPIILHVAQGQGTPRFLTEGRHHRIVQTDTLTLPCKVANIGNLVRAWKRGIAILTAGNVKLSPDERLSLVHGYDLEIKDIRPEDEGDYVCQIASLQPQEITHTVEVLVPPEIVEVTGGGKVEAKKGTPVSLECRAKGNPPPFYQWRRRTNTTYPGLKPINGSTIVMGPVTRHQAGVYQCSASNGVGRPSLKELTLRVLYAPEVDVDEPWVHSGIGNQAVLTCSVYAEPVAEVRWYRSSLKLEVTDDHITERRGHRYRLIIKRVQLQDLDNYTCEAQNNLGKSRQFVVLSGKPHPAVIRSQALSRWKDGYNVSWSIFSYTPLEEHQLFYRRKLYSSNAFHSSLKPRWGNLSLWYHSEWTDVVIPVQNSVADITQEMSYLIRNLEPSTQYEAKVQAKNTFGWNKMSDILVFTTNGLDGPTVESIGSSSQQDNGEVLEVTALGRSYKQYAVPTPYLFLLVWSLC